MRNLKVMQTNFISLDWLQSKNRRAKHLSSKPCFPVLLIFRINSYLIKSLLKVAFFSFLSKSITTSHEIRPTGQKTNLQDLFSGSYPTRLD